MGRRRTGAELATVMAQIKKERALAKQENARNTLKRERFIREYLRTGNPLESARAAGYAEGGPPEDPTIYLRHRASELLRSPYVIARLRHALDCTVGTPNQVLEELTEIAFAPWKDFLEIQTGESEDGTPTVAFAKMNLASKVKALEILAKHFKLIDGDRKPMDPEEARQFLRDTVDALMKTYGEPVDAEVVERKELTS